MTDAALVETARQFYERLNDLPAAGRFLKMFDRYVEFRVDGTARFHLVTRDGQMRVATGPAPAGGERMVLRTDGETLAGILRGHVKYSQAGAGYMGKLMCIEGLGFFPDLSWLGILTRLAQEWR